MNIKYYLKQKQKLIDETLKLLMPADSQFPPVIHKAMNYSIKGGKRIRPILCLACSKICGLNEKKALLAACAIEMIHTYSLIHDDLPAMDNDDYRRGRLACHKKFNEAVAILAGDAFNTLAYNILSKATGSAKTNNRLIKEISEATGTFGMIGGQVVDIENRTPDLPAMEYINTHKTGALIAIACKTGAVIAKAGKRPQEAIYRYGEYIGFAFQIVDDILDDEGLSSIFGRADAYKKAAELINRAKQELRIFKTGRDPLSALADFIIDSL
ncbi:MAG: polyprenyl synthetase family protein [Candidatus Omnitrophica bacterium]|nr:polyprenyl synthetase family protein [Candidatus Omnitrophota bacterium]